MDTTLYTWQYLLFTADILVQKGCLDEAVTEKLIFLYNINYKK